MSKVLKGFRISNEYLEKFDAILSYLNNEVKDSDIEYSQTEVIEKAIDSLYDKTIGKEMGRILKDELGDTISLAVANGLSAFSDNVESRLGLIYHKLSYADIVTQLIATVLNEQGFFPENQQKIADLVQHDNVIKEITKAYLENLIKKGNL